MKLITKIMNIIILSCRKASELIEKRLHFDLKPVEKMQLYLHTCICNSCKSYQIHSKNLDATLNKHMHQKLSATDGTSNGHSDDLKNKIITKLQDNQ